MPTYGDVFPSPVSPDKEETYGDVFPSPVSLDKKKTYGDVFPKPNEPTKSRIATLAFGQFIKELPQIKALEGIAGVGREVENLANKTPMTSLTLPLKAVGFLAPKTAPAVVETLLAGPASKIGMTIPRALVQAGISAGARILEGRPDEAKLSAILGGALGAMIGPKIKAGKFKSTEPLKFPKFKSEITVQPSLFPGEQKAFGADVGELIDPELVKLSKAKGLKEPSLSSITFTDPVRIGLEMDSTGTFNRKMLDPWFRAENKSVEYANSTFKNLLTKYPYLKEGDDLSAAIQRIGEKRALPKDSQFNTPKTIEIIEELRKSYDDLLDMINQARAVAKQDAIPKRKDFFTHFNEISTLGEFFNLIEAPVKDLRLLPQMSPKSPFFSSALKRLGGEFEDDAIGGFRRYVNGASRVIHMTEPGTAIKANLKFMPPNAKLAFEEMVNYGFGKQPQTQLDRFFLRAPMGKLLTNIASRSVANIVGGNWGVALAQSGSVPLIIERAGPINAILGLIDIYGPNAAYKRAFANRVSIGVRSHLNESEFNNNLKEGLKRIVNLPVSMMDGEMSQWAFFSGLRKAKELGLGIKRAISYADNNLVNPANVIYNKSNTPAFLRNATIKNLFPLQRFSTNAANYILKDLPKQSTAEIAQSAAILAGTTIGMTALSKAASDILGITDIREPISTDDIPLIRLIKYGINPPLLRALKFGVSGTTEMLQGKYKKGGTNLMKAGLLTVPPVGGQQIINLITGRPFGGKKR